MLGPVAQPPRGLANRREALGRIVDGERERTERAEEGRALPLVHPQQRRPVEDAAREQPQEIAVVERVVVRVDHERAVRRERRLRSVPRLRADPHDAAKRPPKVALDDPLDELHRDTLAER